MTGPDELTEPLTVTVTGSYELTDTLVTCVTTGSYELTDTNWFTGSYELTDTCYWTG